MYDILRSFWTTITFITYWPSSSGPYRTRSDGGGGSADEINKYLSRGKSFPDKLLDKMEQYAQRYITKKSVGIAIGIGVTTGFLLASAPLLSDLISPRPQNKEIIHQNILGNPQPETYIVKDGVKYFSRIDGKDISDLLNK